MTSEHRLHLEQLGVTESDLQRLTQVPYQEALKLLEALKEKVRRNWKRWAFELHPDRTGGDTQKTDLFQRLTGVRERFEQLTLPPPTFAPVYSYVSTQTPVTPGVVFRSPSRQPPVRVSRNVGAIASNLKP